MHRRIAIKAPVLSPTGRKIASTLQDRMVPSESHLQTRIVIVFVLLCTGQLLSSITTGRKYNSCCLRLYPFLRVSIPAVLSTKHDNCDKRVTKSFASNLKVGIKQQEALPASAKCIHILILPFIIMKATKCNQMYQNNPQEKKKH